MVKSEWMLVVGVLTMIGGVALFSVPAGVIFTGLVVSTASLLLRLDEIRSKRRSDASHVE